MPLWRWQKASRLGGSHLHRDSTGAVPSGTAPFFVSGPAWQPPDGGSSGGRCRRERVALPLDEDPPEDLARRRLGDCLDDLDAADPLERGDVLGDVRDEHLWVDRLVA